MTRRWTRRWSKIRFWSRRSSTASRPLRCSSSCSCSAPSGSESLSTISIKRKRFECGPCGPCGRGDVVKNKYNFWLRFQTVLASGEARNPGRLLAADRRGVVHLRRLLHISGHQRRSIQLRRGRISVHHSAYERAVVHGRPGRHGAGVHSLAPLLHGSKHLLGNGQQSLQQVIHHQPLWSVIGDSHWYVLVVA